jgi:hypothetical protein
MNEMGDQEWADQKPKIWAIAIVDLGPGLDDADDADASGDGDENIVLGECAELLYDLGGRE